MSNDPYDEFGRAELTIGSVSACALTKGSVPRQSITCAAADTDYAASAAVSAAARYIVAYSSAAFLIAMGEDPGADKGVWVAAGLPTTFTVEPSGVAADDTPHVQGTAAGQVVEISELAD